MKSSTFLTRRLPSWPWQTGRKVHEQWPHVLLLITSGGRQPARAEMADHGHFLPKPYFPNEVLREIAELDREAETRKKADLP